MSIKKQKNKASFAKLHTKLTKDDKVYGTTTLGARGQIVIPAQARKDLKLKPGDQLLVMGRMNKALGFIKSDQLNELVEAVMKNVTGTEAELVVKKHLLRVFKEFQNQ